MAWTSGSAAVNTIGKTVEVRGAGAFTIGLASTVTFTVLFGTVNIATFATASVVAATNLPWDFIYTITTATTGGSGTVESHGFFNIKLTAGAGLGGVYLDDNTATSGAISLTGSTVLQIQVTFSANGTGATLNTCVQRQMITGIIN
jgi:hypothetical protein